MNTLAQNQKVVKGLSIAAIVISALAIIFSLVMVFTASATLACTIFEQLLLQLLLC